MAKHTITFTMGNTEYKVETDSDRFQIGTVIFQFEASPTAPQPVARERRAHFTRDQVYMRRTACIRAVEQALPNYGDTALTMIVTNGDTFTIPPHRLALFETICRESGIEPIYVSE